MGDLACDMAMSEALKTQNGGSFSEKNGGYIVYMGVSKNRGTPKSSI